MKYKVIWVDRDYKEGSKVFSDDPSGPPENGLRKAEKFKKSLEIKDKKSVYGLYRSIDIKPIKSNLESLIRRIVKEEKRRLGEGNDSLLDYVLQQMSSGTVASFTGVQDYKTIDRVKQKMVDILQKTGDQQYSISAAKNWQTKP